MTQNFVLLENLINRVIRKERRQFELNKSHTELPKDTMTYKEKKEMTTKIKQLVLATILIVVLLLGCTPSKVETESQSTTQAQSTSQPTKGFDLVFWVYSDFTTHTSGEVMNKWISDFLAKNPDVNSITLVPKNDSELLTGVMAGVGLPDAFSASARDGKKYLEAVKLLNLKPIFEADSKFAEGFYDNALDAITVDDGMWAIPFISYIPVIFRNLTLLEKAGIDSTNGLPSMDIFIEQLRTLKEAGIYGTHSWSAGGFFAPGAILAADADNLTVGVLDGKTTIKPEQVVRTFEYIVKIDSYANKNMTWSDDATLEAFKTDQLAFLLGGPWTEPGIQQSGVNYDIVLVPPFEEGGRNGGLQGWDFIYGVDSGDPARNDAIMRWLKYLGEYEQQKEWTIKIGRPTLREDVMDDPSVLQTMMAKVSSQGLKGGMMQMQFFKSKVFWVSAIGEVAPMVSSGELTPEEGAQKFIELINALYAEAGE